MEKNKIKFANTLIQWGLFLCINIIFVCKYIPRIGLNPTMYAILYGVIVSSLAILYQRIIASHLSERIARNISLVMIIGILTLISLAIIYIPPLSIHVDRWSATSYFLDALFQGIYPYSVHTHVCDTNFPSPFPLWHYFHIPFWLVGDVGWQLIFFLLIFICAIYYFFHSWHAVLACLLLLSISPAYWWEVATRSDSLSNAFFAVACILYIESKQIKMQNKWWILAIIAGCITSTRLSAVIPLALYLFRPWLEATWKDKLIFIASTLGIVIFFFIPYIFWDTDNWIFLQRNPFITQALLGNIWLLIIMVCIAIFIAYQKQTFYYFTSTTSIYIFVFMLVSQFGILVLHSSAITIDDIYYDISYLTLALPYAILALVTPNNMD